MPSFAEIAVPFALALHVAGAQAAAHDLSEEALSALEAPKGAQPASHTAPATGQQAAKDESYSAEADAFEAMVDGLVVRQVRYQQRVFIRISPRGYSSRRNMLAQLPVRQRTTRYKERKPERCVRVERISGVETGSGNRLLLFLENADILSVNLEKACRARDFYSGFYVEPNEDGQICAARDTLQSRNGARCDIERMMELVAIED